jgi:hypothetical protein
MSDQQAPQNGDTPAVAGPTEAPGTQEQQQVTADPYEKRYNDLRPEFDRATAERAELAQWKEWAQLALTTEDADTQRQALQRLGFDVPDEEVEDFEPTEYEDEQVHDPRLDELWKWREEQQRQAQEAAGFEFLTGHINSEVERLGMTDLDDATRQWVLSRALANPGIPAPPGSPHDELPNVEAALQEFRQWELDRQKQWAKTKQNAPYVPSGGLPANEVPDPGTGHNSRMNRAMRALQEQQE